MAENKTGKTVKTTKPVKTVKTVRTIKAVKSVKSVKATKPVAVPAKSTKVVYDIDAYSPPQIAARLDAVAGVKAKDSAASTFLLGVNAGAFIALGA